VIAVLLTAVAAVLALVFTPTTPLDLVRSWGGGFWELLAFAMQMCLIIVSGYVLAVSRPMRALFEAVAAGAKTPRGAVVRTAVLSMLLAWVHWGLSIAGSAVFVRIVARRQPRADYRLLVCCAYLGLGTLWHAGLSASMPLLVALPDHFMVKELGVIPVTRTLFHPFNLALAGVTLLAVTALAARLQPAAGGTPLVDWERVGDPDANDDAAAGETSATAGPAARLERSRLVSLGVGLCGVVWLADWFARRGLAGVNLNTVNFAFLVLGILLHERPASLLAAAERGGRYVGGLIQQFPP
jgi:short-chain fatty acids transporter